MYIIQYSYIQANSNSSIVYEVYIEGYGRGMMILYPTEPNLFALGRRSNESSRDLASAPYNLLSQICVYIQNNPHDNSFVIP